MSYATELIKSRKWYISHEVLYFESSLPQDERDAHVELWENLILIRADDPEEAYQKAMERGRSNEEPVKIDGVDGYVRFLGLKDLVLIYDQLEDGAELEWKKRKVKFPELSSMIRPKEQLHAFNLSPEDDEID